MVERFKKRARLWLAGAIGLALVLGGVALIKAASGSAKSESTVQADVKVGGGYGGARRAEEEEDKEEKEEDSEQTSAGKAYGLAGGPGGWSE